jgi:hypothetical protein
MTIEPRPGMVAINRRFIEHLSYNEDGSICMMTMDCETLCIMPLGEPVTAPSPRAEDRVSA